MFDSFKNLFSKTKSANDPEVYVEIPLDNLEDKLRAHEVGISIPKHGFYDLEKLEKEVETVKRSEQEGETSEEASGPKQVSLIDMDEEVKRQRRELARKLSQEHEVELHESQLVNELGGGGPVEPNKVEQSENEGSQSVVASVGNHYHISPDEGKEDLPLKKAAVQPVVQSGVKQVPQWKPATREEVLGIEHDISFFYRSVAYFIGSLVFITLAFYLFWFSTSTIDTAKSAIINAVTFGDEFIRTDDSVVINADPSKNPNQTKMDVVQFLLNQEVKFGNLIVASPEYVRQIQNGDKIEIQSNKIRGDEFVGIFFPSTSLALRTVAGESYAIGTVNLSSKNENFIALSIANTPVAYKEFLAYEKNAYNDLKDVFGLRNTVGTASFKEVSVNNNVLRALVDDEGIIMVYGFVGTKTLVFTKNADIFEEVYRRLK
jgi:hypothetical protein